MEKQKYINTITKINSVLVGSEKTLFLEIVAKAEKDKNFMENLITWFKSKCKKTTLLRDELAYPFKDMFKDKLDWDNCWMGIDWKSYKVLGV